MIYTKYMFTPGIKWPDGVFSPTASVEDSDNRVEREGEGVTAFALLGYDPEGDRWEVLVVCHSSHGLKRRVRMMFGLDIEWSGDAPLEFDRGQGIDIEEYVTHIGERVIRFGGLMVGMVAAYQHDQSAWLRAHELARRLGVTIRQEA
ncbi:hypothetical protein [Sulfuricystis multivorans]|uniref:hypothetical protein n=1 Tax=Sulfuricystis multivorans TaxID=2211108 RepID=UPI000F83D9E4|nr:hypothetical protein [Sulfuricystis multivorans]